MQHPKQNWITWVLGIVGGLVSVGIVGGIVLYSEHSALANEVKHKATKEEQVKIEAKVDSNRELVDAHLKVVREKLDAQSKKLDRILKRLRG